MTVTAASAARLVAGRASIRCCGIRHHGPGSARALRTALDEHDPDVVLIEGPAEADAIAHLVVDPEMIPPVAMLGHVLDHPERASFAPFASFSPEWVALTWAGRRDVPVRFIDLPLRHSLAPAPDGDQHALDGGGGRRRPVDPLGELAAAAGYDDPERWWEDVIEHRGHAVDPFDAIAEAMVEVRAMVEPTGSPSDPEERRREAYMRTRVRGAVADGFERPLVVCGAWHVPAILGSFSAGSAKSDTAVLRGLPKVKVAITWVPWTHRRLATATGYGAGVTAPGWYHHLFERAGEHVIGSWFTEVARVLRRADHPASTADVVEATRLAEALAILRGRPLPGLQEVDDVARAVLGGGLDTPMRLVSRDLVVGTQIGHVPPSTPMVPLARDLAAQQRAARMKPAAEPTTLELDLRKPLDLRRSHLLHRLVLLGVPWGSVAEGRGTAGTFRETWHLQWEPELDVRTIERAALGTTVESAAAAAVAQRADAAGSLRALTDLLEGCLLGGLDAPLSALVALVADRAAVAADVARLLEALPPLARTVRYGDVRGTDASSLVSVIDGIVGHAATGLRVACTGIDEDSAATMARLLRDAQSALALLPDRTHLDVLHRGVAAIVEGPRLPGQLQGLATRLLADSARMPADEVERRFARALSRGEEPAAGAAFVEGFLGGSGALLVHDPLLLSVLDGWIATLPAAAFADVLPLLRRTFGGFETAERRAIGQRVRTGEAPGSRRGRFELDPERVAAALETIGTMLGVRA